MKRKRFKTTLICSSENIELSLKVHLTMYPNKWDIIYHELSLYPEITTYITVMGEDIILKDKKEIDNAKKSGFKLHFK